MTCPMMEPPPADERLHGKSDESVLGLERFASSIFVPLFATGLFDQTMVPEISAALSATGRIRNDPWGRAARSAASDQLVLLGDDTVRTRESERLVRLHRDVKGVGPDGVRYSALTPELWNWIIYSTFFVHFHGYQVLTGREVGMADAQAIWDHFRAKFSGLELPGQGRMIEDYEELCEYYTRMATERLTTTETTLDAVRNARRSPRPPFLPRVAAPAWALIGPIAGEFGCVLGFGIMHPAVRALVPFEWNRFRRAEFVVFSALARIAYELLPAQWTLTPLARARTLQDANRLTQQYEGLGLTSFVPELPGVSRRFG